MACLAVSFFSTLSYKRCDFREEILIEHKVCVLIFSATFSETFSILRIIQRVIINVDTSTREVPVILVGFRRNLNFLDRVPKIFQISSFI